MSTKTIDIAILANVFTTCPAQRYATVSISGCCVLCARFGGLFDVLETDAAFGAKYRVQCGVPQVREIITVDMGKAA